MSNSVLYSVVSVTSRLDLKDPFILPFIIKIIIHKAMN